MFMHGTLTESFSS
uniref:Uncharacterized protein n=1 Tax=Arundo donax TaxID=35708 RepID=A0A0A9AIH3_ARUDO